MSIVAPPRSLEQRMKALGAANHVRSARRQMKADIKAGTTSYLAILAKPPAWVETMRIDDFLRCTPGVAKKKTAMILKRTHTSPARTLAGLTSRQRLDIASALRPE